MSALGDYIQNQMDERGWKQSDLARASGLTRQVVSHLLRPNDGSRRMIAPATVAGLAKAFGKQEWEIQLAAAESMGLPVDQVVSIVRTAADEPSHRLLEILLAREKARHAASNGVPHGTSEMDPSVTASAPNTPQAANGGSQVSGEAGTRGVLRDPRRRTRGSDTQHESAPPDAHPHLI